MKKSYIFLFILNLCLLGFSQSPIVTIDRANIVGPTTSGNDPSISSSGLIRGSGVNLSNPGATNYTSNQWNATTQSGAATNNEYIEWSTSASADNSIEITEIDIRNRINANGPANWQIFYSLDGFATAGTAVSVPQTSATTATIYNFNSLSIVSGTAGTITFRIYAWNSVTGGGWFRIPGRTVWSAFGVANPGIRLTGTITTTAVNDTESNIIATSFDPTDNIDYLMYSATSGLTTSNAIKIGEFNIQDGGNDLTDADALGTTLTDIGFDISAFSNIEALAIFDGSTNVGEASVSGDSVSINSINSGLGLLCADDSSKTFDVYATFKTNVTDNDQVQLTINLAQADVSTGSSFDFFDAGGAATPILVDDNRIEVTATSLAFDQQPTNGNQFETMLPNPTVIAVDTNSNFDEDYNGSISVSASVGALEGAPLPYTITNGIATLNSIIYSEKITGTSLLAFGGGFFTMSDVFDINGPIITVAVQDFDTTTPEWTYTNDITFFDNGWGTDGYYDIIDAASASPLDYSMFSGNILGENDLNDEGDNGTTGFATITFDTIDVASYENISVTFDWDIHGYVNNNNDAQYRLILDGVAQPFVFLLDGNGAIDTDEGSVKLSIPDGTDTVALVIRVRNNRLAGFSGFDNFKIISEFDGLLYSDSSWTPNAPSPTTAMDNALVLDGTYIVGSNIELNNLYISDGALASVALGQSITSESITVSGTLLLNSASSSYSSLITNKADGEVTYERHVNQFANTGSSTGKNDLISAPVTNTNQTFLALRTANADIPSGTIGGVPSFLFGPFDNDIDSYVNYNASDDPSLIESGVGYRTASIQVGGSKFTFLGDVETSAVSVGIDVGTASIFNLVGNPYPSYITLSGFLSDNSTEFDASMAGVYGYDGEALDGFTVWNQAYSDANPNALIAPGQGFLVSSKVGGGMIDFNTNTRSKGTTDDFILGRTNATPLNAFLNLELSTNETAFKTDLYFNENASLGMDPGYDAVIFNEFTPDFSIYSHLVENNTGKDMAVQSVGYGDLNTVTIPLGVNAHQGEQLTIAIADTNISDDTFIYLEDNVNQTFTNLKLNDYVFTPATTLTETGRFYIHFSRSQLSDSDHTLNGLEIYTESHPKTIVIKGQIEVNTFMQLYDIQGRVVKANPLNSKDTKQIIDASHLSAGVYIVQLKNTKGQRSQKVIIK